MSDFPVDLTQLAQSQAPPPIPDGNNLPATSNAAPPSPMALAMARQQAGQQPPPQTSNQPPRPQLILEQLIRGLAKPPQTPPDAMGVSRPVSRLDTFESFLGNFVNALGHGLAASGHGPGAFGRGFGAAVTAPYEQAQQQFQQSQAAQANQAEIQQKQAQSQLTQAQTGMYGQTVMTPYGPMNQALAAKVFPAMIRAEGQTTSATIGANARIKAARLGLGPTVDVPKDLQEQLNLPPQLPLKMLNQAESAANKPLTVVQGASDAYVVNKDTNAKKALGVGSGRIAATMARPVQVADPNAPGGVRYMPAGEAMRTGAPAASSASVTAPKAVIKEFTSGTAGKTLNSFNTATDHLRILSQLGDALNNGSTPLINRFANAYATQTGGAAPTTFNMAKQAVAGEIAKTFKGQATEGEITAINSTLNAAQSPAQLKGAISTALQLMESKRQALLEQYNAGIKAQPAFPQPKAGGGSVDNLLNKHGF